MFTHISVDYSTNVATLLYTYESETVEIHGLVTSTEAMQQLISVANNYTEGKGAFLYFNGSDIKDGGTAPANTVWDWSSYSWKDPRTLEDGWRIVKEKRSVLLQQSDWTQLPDVPLVTRAKWVEYRQALRDITNQTDPFNIVWPMPPEG